MYIYVVLPATYRLTYIYILIYIYSLMQNPFSKKKKIAMQNYIFSHLCRNIYTHLYIHIAIYTHLYIYVPLYSG